MAWRQEPPTSSARGLTTTRKHLRDKKRRKQDKAAKLSRLQKPEEMSLEAWQIELRRQFGRDQSYLLKNLGAEPIFSEFEVTNPQSQNAYRVHIRGPQLGDNYCSCPDFATNTLGTCKHIEFTLATLERKRGGATALRSGFQPAYSEIFLQYGARRDVRFRPGSSCSKEMARLAALYFSPEGTLLPEGFNSFETFLADANQLEDELRYHDDVLALVAEVRDAGQRQQRVKEAFPRDIQSAAFKDLVRAQLYDYQREGALFAAQAGRCLLGDEMGLGKTVQAIAATEIMARLFGVERVLIVCPTSLKHQWQREIERFVDRRVEVVNGLRGAREGHYATDSFFKITNYDTVHRDLDLIEHWGPDLVILDEAQRIKNWATRVARSVKRITSPYAMVLTGTPLENRLEELISITQFVDRFRLGPTFRLLHEHQVRDEHGKVVGYQNLDRIGETLKPILLRRRKAEVLDQLPERIDTNLFVPMTELQRTHHSENRDIVVRIVAKWRRYRFLSEADKRRLMTALLRMRMSCDNSYLVDHQSDQGTKTDEILTLLEEYCEQPGTKVVIFSQWLRMHELLVKRLEERGLGYVLFHGGVPGSQRKDLVDRFREDPNCRAFLSTDAGGTGLNLQHANVVMNVDLPWNPAVLEQRIGRVHRLGQKQPVEVVNFVAQGTIEEGMLSVLKFKSSLFAGVLDGGEKDVFLGGTKLNKFMETVENTTAAIPEAAPDSADTSGRTVDDRDPDALAGDALSRPRRSGKQRGAATAAQSNLPEAQTPSGPASDPWAGLLQTGMALLQQVVSASQNAACGGSGTATQPTNVVSSMVRRDERTGETYLKLPVPSPEVLDQALKALGTLVQSLRR